MVAQYLDFTEKYNATGSFVVETSGWDYCVIQAVGIANSITFNTTIDSGAIQGVTDGSFVSSDNYVSAVGVLLSDGVTKQNKIDAPWGLIKFNVIGRYMKFVGGVDGSTKVLIMLAKIG